MKKILIGLMLILATVNTAFANKFHGVIHPLDYIMLPISTFKPENTETLRHPFPIKQYEYGFFVHSNEKNPTYISVLILGTLDLISYNQNTGDFIYKLSLSNFGFSKIYWPSTREYIPKYAQFTFDESKKNYLMISGRYDKKTNTAIPKKNSLMKITQILGGVVILHSVNEIPFTITYD